METTIQEKGKFTYFTDDGMEFTLEIPRYWDTIYKGKPRERLYEEYIQMLNYVKKCAPNRYICDIGVNHGLFAVPVCLLNYPLIGFEPVKSNYEDSVNNLTKNGCSDWHLSDYALSSKNETTTIYIPICTDNSSLSKEAAVANMGNKEYKEQTVNCIKFDDWIKENPQYSDISLIKCDSQGMDMDIILGASEFLKQAKDIYIIAEYEEHLLKMGHSYQDLDNLFLSLDFKQVGKISNDKVWYKQ